MKFVILISVFLSPVLGAASSDECARLLKGVLTSSSLFARPLNAEPLYRKIRQLMAENDFQNAAVLNEEVLAVYPESPISLVYKATILKGLGQDKRAQSLISDFESQNLTEVFDVTELTTAARALAESGWPAQSLKLYRRAVSLDTKSEVGWHNLSLVRMDPEKLDEFLDHFVKDLKENPQDRNLLKQLVRLLIRNEQSGRALRIVDGVLSVEPENAEAHKQKIAALVALKNWATAIEVGTEAIRLNPESASTWGNYALALAKSNQLENASAAIQRAEELGSNDPLVRKILVGAWMQQQRWPEALESVEIALRSKPRNVSLLTQKKRVLLKLGRLQDAHETISAILSKNPSSIQDWVDRASIRYKLHRLAESEQDALQALAMYPDQVNALNLMTNLSLGQRKFDVALGYNQHSLSITERVPLTWGLRARIHYHMGEFDQALADLDKEASLHPKYRPDSGLRARLYLAAGRISEGIVFVQTLPLGGQRAFYMARLFAAKNLFNDALATIEECEDGPGKFWFKAYYQFRLGLESEAIRTLLATRQLIKAADADLLAAILWVEGKSRLPRNPVVHEWLKTLGPEEMSKVFKTMQSFNWDQYPRAFGKNMDL